MNPSSIFTLFNLGRRCNRRVFSIYMSFKPTQFANFLTTSHCHLLSTKPFIGVWGSSLPAQFVSSVSSSSYNIDDEFQKVGLEEVGNHADDDENGKDVINGLGTRDEKLNRDTDAIVGTFSEVGNGAAEGKQDFEQCGIAQTRELAGKINGKLSSSSNIDDKIEKVELEEVCDHSDDDDVDDDDKEEIDGLGIKDEKLIRDTDTIVGVLSGFGSGSVEVKRKLEQCGIAPTRELVVEVLSRVRNDWAAAFTFFLWAGKQERYSHSVREYHSMIAILGKMRKFDTAWALIDEMRGGKEGLSLVSPQTLLIMIRKYCAVHDVGKAINTFYALKRFGLKIGIEELQDLLSALCRYKNVQDAEYLLFCNEKVFPLNTKSFNIILNGWCNMVVNLGEAKRFWRLMGKKGIVRDTVSYSSMMSCYSKISNLHEVLKLFNRMQDLGIALDRKVYNATIHALAKGKLVKEAFDLLKTMEEKGFKPNAVTYNSLIKPLCKARRVDDARIVFDEMLQKGFSPTIRTYHAFLDILKTCDEVYELLEKMKSTGCNPINDTYIMLIRKFCRWRQIDNVFKLWSEMGENGLSHDRSSYIVLVHGLFLNGKLEDAWKYYEEMKQKGFLPEPKTEEMLQAYNSAKQTAGTLPLTTKYDQANFRSSTKNARVFPDTYGYEKDFLKQPETRKVTRERGFSFWDK